MRGVLERERERPVEGHAGAEQRGGIAGPQRHGGAPAEPPPRSGDAAAGRFINGDRVEMLPAQLRQDGLPRRRLDHAFDDVPVRGRRPVPEANAHPSASSRVTRSTSSSVEIPAQAFAQPAARSGAIP